MKRTNPFPNPPSKRRRIDDPMSNIPKEALLPDGINLNFDYLNNLNDLQREMILFDYEIAKNQQAERAAAERALLKSQKHHLQQTRLTQPAYPSVIDDSEEDDDEEEEEEYVGRRKRKRKKIQDDDTDYVELFSPSFVFVWGFLFSGVRPGFRIWRLQLLQCGVCVCVCVLCPESLLRK